MLSETFGAAGRNSVELISRSKGSERKREDSSVFHQCASPSVGEEEPVMVTVLFLIMKFSRLWSREHSYAQLA